MSRTRGVRPALTTLLSVRHARAEAASAEHGAAVAACEEARRQIADLQELLASHEVTGTRWVAGVDERARLGRALAAARVTAAQAEAAAEEARRRWVVERRSERVVEKLVERVSAARAAAAARAEQAVLDEVGLVAHARSRPAAGPDAAP